MTEESRLLVDFGSLPFHIGPKPSPRNGCLPDTLPFRVGVRSDCDLMIQLPSKEVAACLSKAYVQGTIIANPMSEAEIGRKYAEDFLEFILNQVAVSKKDVMNVLEIGCGYGYLLYRLKRHGFHVLGIEPGRQGQDGSRKYGVEIIQDTFPGKTYQHERAKYDIIIHYAVMEHIEDSVLFLRKQAEHLSKSGLILFSVPDCSEYILFGDISILLHEHWNYYTPYSLKKVVERAGLKLIHLEKAGYGGALYGVAAYSGRTVDIPEYPDYDNQFKKRVEKSLVKAKEYFQKALKRNLTVGIFCPGRAINFLYLIKSGSHLRFFDDDEHVYGKYFPPFKIPIESRKSLISDPVDSLLIMSRTFGEDIKMGLLAERQLKDMEIVMFSELTRI